MKAALVVVDVQNDFVPPDGALAVPDGAAVIPVINGIADQFDTVIATQDWHPENHFSFADQGGPWPVHCVQNAFGAELHGDLSISPTLMSRKGDDPQVDGYSAFEDTPLDVWLKDRDIDTLFVAGLATDYCVKASVLDALGHGFNVYVIQDGCRAVNVNAGDDDKAWTEMTSKGATLIDSSAVAEVLAAA